MDLRTEILTKLPVRKKVTPSGWLTINCPMCTSQGQSRNDTKSRGGFVFKDGLSYHCFNCNYKASYQTGRLLNKKMRMLLTGIGFSDSEVKTLQLQAMKEKSDEPDTFKPSYDDITFKEVALPQGAKLFEEFTDPKDAANIIQLYKYIHQRNLLFYKNYYYTNVAYNNFNNRVIVPFTYKGKTVGYSARLFKDSKGPKYYTSSQPGYMFNMDNLFKERKYVILVEGVFDAIAIDGVAVLHNELNPNQINLINKAKITSEIIVCADKDKAGNKLVKTALDNDWSVSFPEFEKGIKDCADAVQKYGQILTIRMILDNIVRSKTKIQVLTKIGA